MAASGETCASALPADRSSQIIHNHEMMLRGEIVPRRGAERRYGAMLERRLRDLCIEEVRARFKALRANTNASS